MKSRISFKEEYYKRLSQGYVKGGVEKLFVDQFMSGSGNELKEKFWSPKSSARLCFDLYSWMGEDEAYDDVQFEFKLCCLSSGGRKVYANMDVYYVEKDVTTFIESKNTETADNAKYITELPEAYWNTEQIYKSSNGRKDVSQSIESRYFGRNDVMEHFLAFIDEVKEEAEKCGAVSWFDAKQETCHLLGIVNYILSVGRGGDVKVVNFYNVAANYEQDDFAEFFRSKAEAMVRDIIEGNNMSVQFNYGLYSVKEFFEGNRWLDKKAYATDVKIRDLLSELSRYVSDPLA